MKRVEIEKKERQERKGERVGTKKKEKSKTDSERESVRARAGVYESEIDII